MPVALSGPLVDYIGPALSPTRLVETPKTLNYHTSIDTTGPALNPYWLSTIP